MSGVPKTPTMTARVVRAPTTPQIGDRQPRVLPTARTMVKASTHSTTLARKAGSAATTSVNRLALIFERDSRTARTEQCYGCTFGAVNPGLLPPRSALAGGGLWPLLSEDRGEYDLASQDRSGAVSLLEAMLAGSSGVGLVPEQVWELADLAPSVFGTDPTLASMCAEGEPEVHLGGAASWMSAEGQPEVHLGGAASWMCAEGQPEVHLGGAASWMCAEGQPEVHLGGAASWMCAEGQPEVHL